MTPNAKGLRRVDGLCQALPLLPVRVVFTTVFPNTIDPAALRQVTAPAGSKRTCRLIRAVI